MDSLSVFTPHEEIGHRIFTMTNLGLHLDGRGISQTFSSLQQTIVDH